MAIDVISERNIFRFLRFLRWRQGILRRNILHCVWKIFEFLR